MEYLGEWDNTVVIFFSDNGGLPAHGSVNHPFRGSKGDYWEGGVHVPAFVSGGYTMAALRENNVEPYRYGHLVHVTDVHAIALGLGGQNEEDSLELDGIDLWKSLVETQDPAREAVVINVNSPNFAKSGAVRWGKYKLIRNPEPSETAIYSRVKAKLVAEGLDVSEVRQNPSSVALGQPCGEEVGWSGTGQMSTSPMRIVSRRCGCGLLRSSPRPFYSGCFWYMILVCTKVHSFA